MFRLFYVSTVAPDFEPQQIEGLVSEAAEKNKAIGVTGVLKFTGDNFGQVLEGEESAVRHLFEKIRRDKRHQGVVVLSERSVTGKRYADWGMKLLPASDFAGFAAEMMD